MRGLYQAFFFASVAFSLYTVAGYPLLLALWARFHARPVHRKFAPVPVTILLPVRNGERWLRAKLDSLSALDYPREFMARYNEAAVNENAKHGGHLPLFSAEILKVVNTTSSPPAAQ